MAKDDFVDLYEILQVPPETHPLMLKKRITEMYLEAQKNLDHRNAQKKLHYQQLYEVYLPQARHLLLDANHRAEYDRYLQAFRTGKAVQEIEKSAPQATSTVTSQDEDLKEMDARGVDPAKLAAEREQLWSKWKSGLESGGINEYATAKTAESHALDSVPKIEGLGAADNASQHSLPSVSPLDNVPKVNVGGAARPAVAVPATRPAATVQPRASKRSWASQNTEDTEEKRREEEAERDRAKRRQEITIQKAESARKTYKMLGALIVFAPLVGLYVAFIQDTVNDIFVNMLGSFGLGVAWLITLGIVGGAAYAVSNWAGQMGYDKTLVAAKEAELRERR